MLTQINRVAEKGSAFTLGGLLDFVTACDKLGVSLDIEVTAVIELLPNGEPQNMMGKLVALGLETR